MKEKPEIIECPDIRPFITEFTFLPVKGVIYERPKKIRGHGRYSNKGGELNNDNKIINRTP